MPLVVLLFQRHHFPGEEIELNLVVEELLFFRPQPLLPAHQVVVRNHLPILQADLLIRDRLVAFPVVEHVQPDRKCADRKVELLPVGKRGNGGRLQDTRRETVPARQVHQHQIKGKVSPRRNGDGRFRLPQAVSFVTHVAIDDGTATHAEYQLEPAGKGVGQIRGTVSPHLLLLAQRFQLPDQPLVQLVALSQTLKTGIG